jgi:hypothetical protein
VPGRVAVVVTAGQGPRRARAEGKKSWILRCCACTSGGADRQKILRLTRRRPLAVFTRTLDKDRHPRRGRAASRAGRERGVRTGPGERGSLNGPVRRAVRGCHDKCLPLLHIFATGSLPADAAAIQPRSGSPRPEPPDTALQLLRDLLCAYGLILDELVVLRGYSKRRRRIHAGRGSQVGGQATGPSSLMPLSPSARLPAIRTGGPIKPPTRPHPH